MLIGICGGICSGKKTVAQYLVDHHGFRLLRLESPSGAPSQNETPHNGTPRNETPRTETPRREHPRNETLRPDAPEFNAPPPGPEEEFGAVPTPIPLDELEDWGESVDDDRPKKGKGKGKNGQTWRAKSDNQQQGKNAHAICYSCKQKGHMKGECPSNQRALTINPARINSVKEVARPPSVATLSTIYPPPSNDLSFASAEALLEYVTVRWQARFVTTDVHNEAILDHLARRPFFMLISVDSPLTVRYARFRHRNPNCTLESFALASDRHLYDPKEGLQPLISRATVRLLNTSSSLAHLYATLGKLKLADPVRLRPSWDAYFMSLATLASLRSNCMKRRVGAVLVGREKRVISTGYNGTPRGLQNCSEGGCARCNSGNSSGVGLATCLCIHAEENALLEAGRERIREGAVLYCDTCPCLTCSIKICQVGIEEVIYAHGYSMDTETAAVFRQAGVKLRQYIPPPNGLIHLENLDKIELY
ncbi:Deoxycytidylate deaminase [Colletotrichum sidae]|uniref:Deoxycytidylate deaminase n=1 Tax=Colletotrichum sidae TaxID=1347389 RepID=A0A4R8T3B4_9PEZI|nr:Deoxycytidylate deaminase [Colletotrichum sidae]